MSRKALALGCAVVVLLVVVAGAAGFYFFVWVPGQGMIRTGVDAVRSGKDYVAGFSRLAEVAELDGGIASDPAYAPPAERILTARQVEGFVAVQRRVREATGERFEQVVDRYRGLGEPGAEVTPSQVAAALNDFATLAVDAKRVQVAAVNELGFSRQEYNWVKTQVYLALGLGDVSEVDLDRLMEAAKKGDLEALAEGVQRTDRPAVPPANRALVEPHRDELQQYLPLAVVGL
jgi:hypothetical protein